jgi:type IV pilus assembly protein PilP
MHIERASVAFALSWALAVAGCAEDEVVTAPKPGASSPRGPRAPSGAAATSTSPLEEEAAPPAVEFQEADFSETERSRDPFRNFARHFVDTAKSRIKTQREVILDQYAIDELRLVGIVSRITPPKAMLVDPTGKGHVITRGQFVGRAEIVQGGTSGADYEINWRVERIREQDIVLVREDPANPDVPSATRVITLRPNEPG